MKFYRVKGARATFTSVDGTTVGQYRLIRDHRAGQWDMFENINAELINIGSFDSFSEISEKTGATFHDNAQGWPQ